MKKPEKIDPDKLARLDGEEVTRLFELRKKNKLETQYSSIIDALFDATFSNPEIDSKLQEQLLSLKTPLLRHCQNQTKHFDLIIQHYSNFVEIITNNMIGWRATLGRGGETCLDRVSDAIYSFNQAHSSQEFKDITETLNGYFLEQKWQIERIEKRLAAKEVGILKAEYAKICAAKLLNECTSKKSLPSVIVDFLHNHWHTSLQLILLNEGERSSAWRTAIKTTQSLIWSLQPEITENEKNSQRLYRIIEEIPDLLSEQLLSLNHAPDQLEEQIKIIQDTYHYILKGIPLESIAFPKIETGSLMPEAVRLSESLIKAVNDLYIGQWFTLNLESHQDTIKLILSIEDSNQHLFTNYLGMKALQIDTEQLAFMLSNGTITAITQPKTFAESSAEILNNLHQEYLQTEAKNQADIARELFEQKRRDQEQRELARKKALAEAQQLAEQKKRLEQERETGLDKVASIQVGSWIEKKADEEWVRYKLAVKLLSSNKYIFVDRNGLNRWESSKENLCDAITANFIRIVSSGKEFEKSLEQVVSSLRRNPKAPEAGDSENTPNQNN